VTWSVPRVSSGWTTRPWTVLVQGVARSDPMLRTPLMVAAVLTVWSVAGCGSVGGPVPADRSDAGQVSPDEGVELAAVIRFLDLEGGCWVIDAGSRGCYVPVNMPAEFRQGGLPVTVRVVPRDLASICMVGPVVEILSIRSR